MKMPAESDPVRVDGRMLHVDHLRGLVILGLILFHTARLFDDDPWHMKDAGQYLAADILVAVFNVVQMPLLFLLTGLTIHFSLQKRTAGRFVQERGLRLLLPLVVGILVAVVPQVWVERIAHGLPGRSSPIDFDGGFLAFYPQFFQCCYPAANFSWHHLWFLVYLLAYSLALLPIFLLLRRAIWPKRLAEKLANGFGLCLLGLPVILAEVALRRSFPQTHALIDDWANHAHYGLLILIGWMIAASPLLATAVKRYGGYFLGAAVLLICLWLGLMLSGIRPTLEIRLILRTAAEWSALLGALGVGAAYLNRPLPFLTGFGRLSFPFYIFHQTAIVLLGYLFLAWSEQPLLKFLAIAGLSFAISLGLSRLVGTNRITAMLFGMR
ncbi:acyltransferase family protein [Lacibacterium aquatile]|uniref:Acyltransferase family protein n=1 Tax=Lacibacterium aquatile TaxID=1168082 RepID=A0ABW5DSW6_9PROT